MFLANPMRGSLLNLGMSFLDKGVIFSLLHEGTDKSGPSDRKPSPSLLGRLGWRDPIAKVTVTCPKRLENSVVSECSKHWSLFHNVPMYVYIYIYTQSVGLKLSPLPDLSGSASDPRATFRCATYFGASGILHLDSLARVPARSKPGRFLTVVLFTGTALIFRCSLDLLLLQFNSIILVGPLQSISGLHCGLPCIGSFH